MIQSTGLQPDAQKFRRPKLLQHSTARAKLLVYQQWPNSQVRGKSKTKGRGWGGKNSACQHQNPRDYSKAPYSKHFLPSVPRPVEESRMNALTRGSPAVANPTLRQRRMALHKSDPEPKPTFWRLEVRLYQPAIDLVTAADGQGLRWGKWWGQNS